MEFEKYYLINVLETQFDEDDSWTCDYCNICDAPIVSFDVSEVKDFYWQRGFKDRVASGANDIDIFIETFTIEHMKEAHEAEATLISMDSDNKDLIRSFIGDKVEDAAIV